MPVYADDEECAGEEAVCELIVADVGEAALGHDGEEGVDEAIGKTEDGPKSNMDTLIPLNLRVECVCCCFGAC